MRIPSVAKAAIISVRSVAWLKPCPFKAIDLSAACSSPNESIGVLGSVERIDGQAAEQFREKVGGLLGHHVAGKGNFPELLHGDGVGEENDIGFAAANLFYCFAGVTQVANVGLLANLFGVQAEQAVEDDGVEMA